jgi:IS1 family transposase
LPQNIDWSWAHNVGGHEEEDADELVRQTKRRISRLLPLFVSDGWDAYIKALLKAFHRLAQTARIACRGRPRRAVLEPDPELRYAQVVKIREKNPVIKVQKRTIFGEPKEIEMKQVSTSLVERLNLSFRQENARLSRKTLKFSKMLYRLKHQVALYGAFVNWVRVHRSLRQKLNDCLNDNICYD